MAETNEYMEEAYHTLVKLSADEEKRLEYKAREKALRDYNSQMNSAEKRGQEQGVKLAKTVFKLQEKGWKVEEIAEECDISVEQVKEILE